MKHNKLDKLIDNHLTKFFYNKIIFNLEIAMDALIEEENFEGAALVRDQILELKEELNKELDG
jgi:protein-arginine kinase activator protein McsA